jgi:hypothetical protein
LDDLGAVGLSLVFAVEDFSAESFDLVDVLIPFIAVLDKLKFLVLSIVIGVGCQLDAILRGIVGDFEAVA